MKQDKKSEIITSRFSTKDVLEIEEYAEILNVTKAEILRLSWKSFQDSNMLKKTHSKLLTELTKRIFLIACSTINLSAEERKIAASEINEKLKREEVNE
jgi:hypothetical protein